MIMIWIKANNFDRGLQSLTDCLVLDLTLRFCLLDLIVLRLDF